jgi:hypothetical protein
VVAQITPETTIATAHAHLRLHVVLGLETTIAIAIAHPCRLHVVVGMETTIATAHAHPRHFRVGPLRQEVAAVAGPNVEAHHAVRVVAAAVDLEVEDGKEEDCI